MNAVAMNIVTGFLFGSGMIIAAFVFKSLWSVGLCGG